MRGRKQLIAEPRIPFAPAVGVMGHRLDTISAEALLQVERRLAEAFDLFSVEARVQLFEPNHVNPSASASRRAFCGRRSA